MLKTCWVLAGMLVTLTSLTEAQFISISFTLCFAFEGHLTEEIFLGRSEVILPVGTSESHVAAKWC